MTLEELQNFLDLYGSEKSRWPRETAAAIETFVQSSPEAAAVFHDAQRTEAILRLMDVDRQYPVDLEKKILQRVQVVVEENAEITYLQKFFRPHYAAASAFGLVAAAVFGFIVGIGPQQSSDYILDPVFYDGSVLDEGDVL